MTMTRACVMLSVLALVFASACATALSTAQSPEALPSGTWQVHAGSEINVNVSRVADAIDKALDLEDRIASDPTYTPSDEERREYADAAIGLALNAPGPIFDLMVRRGFGHRVDAGIRYTTTGLGLDLKLQFLGGGSAAGWDGAISLGYMRHSFDGFIFDLLEKVHVDDFTRHDLIVPLIFGRPAGRFGRVWLGPKFQMAWVHVDATLQDISDEPLTTDDEIYYFGGFAGVSGGYKGIEAYLELTVMYAMSNPLIYGRERDLGGVIVAPTVGLSARF
jgi:hypothetical protein